MNFEELVRLAKSGDQQAAAALLEMYRPLLGHAAIVDGRYDEDLYQELCVTFLRCVQLFCIP